MPNIQLLEKTLPAAPLRIAALESCLPLAQKVDDYIVTFRKSALEIHAVFCTLRKLQKGQLPSENFLPAFRLRRSKGMIHELSAVQIYLSW